MIANCVCATQSAMEARRVSTGWGCCELDVWLIARVGGDGEGFEEKLGFALVTIMEESALLQRVCVWCVWCSCTVWQSSSNLVDKFSFVFEHALAWCCRLALISPQTRHTCMHTNVKASVDAIPANGHSRTLPQHFPRANTTYTKHYVSTTFLWAPLGPHSL